MSQTEVQLIKDAVIVNADVSNSAAIDVSKISGALPAAGGTITGDVTFDGETAGRDIVFDRSENSLEFADNAFIKFGTGDDLQIYHSGSHSIIKDAGTGNLRIQTNNLRVENAAGTENQLLTTENDGVELYYDNSKILETESWGVMVTGTVEADQYNLQDSDGTTQQIRIGASGDLRLFHQSGENIIGANTVGQDIFFKSSSSSSLDTTSFVVRTDGSVTHLDNIKMKFGTSDDLQIYHNGTDSLITDSGTGSLLLGGSAVFIQNAAHDENMIRAIADGAVDLYHNGSSKFQTLSDGVNVTGTLKVNGSAFSGGIASLVEDTSPQLGGDLDTNSHHILLDDDHEVKFGDDSDLRIFHANGNANFIQSYNDIDLRIHTFGNTAKIRLQVNESENAVVCNPNGAVELYEDNTKKFVTTSTGARVENTSSPLTSANSSGNEFVVTGDGAMGITLHTTSTTSNCALLFADGTSGTDLYRGSVIYRHLHDQLRFNVNGGTLAQQINSDLTVSFQNTIYASSFSTGSDLTLKSNLVRFTNTLDKLKEITGYTFDMKVGEAKDITIPSAGIIAQDVEKVFPELVSTETGSDYKTVQYNGLIGVLVEAVKELTTKVAALEAA